MTGTLARKLLTNGRCVDKMMRGSKRWFTVEAKSFEILVEGVGRRKQYFIIEKSKGGISWIRFGEGSLGTLGPAVGSRSQINGG